MWARKTFWLTKQDTRPRLRTNLPQSKLKWSLFVWQHNFAGKTKWNIIFKIEKSFINVFIHNKNWFLLQNIFFKINFTNQSWKKNVMVQINKVLPIHSQMEINTIHLKVNVKSLNTYSLRFMKLAKKVLASNLVKTSLIQENWKNF